MGPQRDLESMLLTLQKSIDFTPLLPSAGPTGGLGLACPAPTMSFTTTSVAERALDMIYGGRAATAAVVGGGDRVGVRASNYFEIRRAESSRCA